MGRRDPGRFDRFYRVDRARSLAELEGHGAERPSEPATGLVERCERAWRTPLGALTDEQLVLLLSQRFDPHWLAPLAIERLRDDPSAHRWSPGDLAYEVLTLGAPFWSTHPHLADELRAVLAAHTGRWDERLRPLIDAFLA